MTSCDAGATRLSSIAPSVLVAWRWSMTSIHEIRPALPTKSLVGLTNLLPQLRLNIYPCCLR